MDRRELKGILTKMKNQLKKGIAWEDLDIIGVWDNDGEYYITYKEYNGTITKAELNNLDCATKVDWYKQADDSIIFEYDRYKNELYAEVYLSYTDTSGFYNHSYLQICNTKVL